MKKTTLVPTARTITAEEREELSLIGEDTIPNYVYKKKSIYPLEKFSDKGLFRTVQEIATVGKHSWILFNGTETLTPGIPLNNLMSNGTMVEYKSWKKPAKYLTEEEWNNIVGMKVYGSQVLGSDDNDQPRIITWLLVLD